MNTSRGFTWRSKSKRRLALAVCAVGVGGATPLLAAERVGVVAVTGGSANGAPNTAFSAFGLPIINGPGQVAFSTVLTGSGATANNDTGVWIGSSPLTLAKAVREGDNAVGTSIPTTYSDFRTDIPVYSAFNNAGQIGLTFIPLKSGTSSANYGQFAGAAGAIKLINRNSEAYPAPYTGTWAGKMFLGINGNGRLAIGDLYTAGFVGSSTASLTLVAKVGNAAPGVPNATFDQVYPGTIYLNDAGAVTFGSTLKVGASFVGNTLFAGTSAASIGKLAASGDAVPALGAGYSLSTIGDAPSLDRSGQILLAANVSTPSSGTAAGLWLTSSSRAPLQKVALGTDAAPGLAAGVRFGAFSGARLAADDLAVFNSTVTGSGVTTSNDSVIWRYDHGAFKSIARESDQAPGAPAGTKLSSFSALTTNTVGQVAFTATLTSTSGTSTALLGFDASLGLTVLAKKGDVLQLSPTDSRTLASLTLALLDDGGNGQDGQATALNDAGQVAFRAVFTDNTQAILTTRIPVAGDANYDGIVDTADFKTLMGHYGRAGVRADGDFNGDGLVDFIDFQMLEQNFGRHPPPVAAPPVDASRVGESVPEPSALALGLLVGWGHGRRRRRRRS
ncbi:MAG: hypothetical protein JWN40_3076 [Phycisphaerales bacterium]|nr:hypothetical protein [Phycisphaerales bacterium]